ncbi:Acylphosphate phosphohydrolase, putative [Weissella jogaejeotgali]|uniref:acylphosphatase n=2 Tax=Weissella TaxID=46255 RepID=A0A1L6RE32_9LACO|nr:acylphosphatase [Weissella jogaejeotgali]APS42748.1 Acylphosphate phosphohydrolase, putative [Weissella jogaejeotgali]CCC56804.1 acylphosphatase [Weissella thailandensis fsh4-2]
MLIAKKIIVRGRVQGVGFRYSTKNIADKLGIQGNVWNETDGSVHIEAQAESDAMSDFISKISMSPSPYARIDSVDSKDIPINEHLHRFRAL